MTELARKRALMGTAAAFTLMMAAASQAHAQQGGAVAAADADAAGEVQEIVVTGTAIRGVAPVGSATVNVTRDAILETGARDASTLISQLPQGSGLGTTLNNSGGRNAGVNLRGLGNNATLLLIDGHRTVQQGVTNQISDPNTIPFAAIERVEVVTDGASAIYGSDAVAGVVNYILRKDFEGMEMSVGYTNNLYDQFRGEVLIGHSWGSGSVMAGLSAEGNNHVKRNARPYLMDDLRAYGGNDGRFNGLTVFPGSTPVLIAGNTVYGLPANLNGRVPTAAEVLARRNQPTDLQDQGNVQDYYTRRTRQSGIFRLNQDFGRAGEVTFTTLFNIRENKAPGGDNGSASAYSLTVRPSSPFYIQGLGSGNQRLVYNVRANYPDPQEYNQENYEKTINNTLEYRVDLFRDFQFTGIGTYGTNYGCGACHANANTVLADVILDPRLVAVYGFNPYQAGPQTGAAKLVGGFTQEATNKLIDLVGKVDGSLFALPAGELRIAVGAEYQKHDFWLHAQNALNEAGTYQTSRLAKSHRIIESAFGEVFVPIFGTANAIPGFQRLDLSAAVRYDKYSDIEKGTTNPKVGVSWRPVDDLLIRGSWGTSFRAATLGESDPRTVGQTNRTLIINGLNDPRIPVTIPATGQSLVLNRGGNTAGLKPESATVWSLGSDYNPSFIPGLRLGVTYYNVNYKDRIENLPNATLILSSPAVYEQYKDFFIVAPQPASCVNGAQPGLPGQPQYATYNPAYLPWLSDPNAVYSPTSQNDCQLVGIIAGGRLNLGRVKQSGLDFNARYEFETEFARITLNGNFTKILKLQRSLLPTSPLFDALDTIGNQVSERGRASVSMNRGPFTANVQANYIGSYLNNATITVNGVKYPDTKVPSWTTFDAGLSYNVPRGSSGVMEGVRVSLNVTNFTDKDPPIVLSGGSAIDDANHNIWGRYWSFEISKRF
jgi:iron complex outermembrane receptor protein